MTNPPQLICRHCRRSETPHDSHGCASFNPMDREEWLRWVQNSSGVLQQVDGVVYNFSDAVVSDDFEKFALCDNCGMIRRDHQDDKCLFDSSMFTPKTSQTGRSMT